MASATVRTRITSMPAQGLGRRGRHERPPEPQARRLGEAPLELGDLADLAAQAHLAAGDQIGRHRDVLLRRREREHETEVGPWLVDVDPADRERVHVVVLEHDADPLLDHGGEQGEAARVDALAGPAGHRSPPGRPAAPGSRSAAGGTRR